jgi:hypothetical protein
VIRVGPLRDAPNPLQRQFARYSLAFPVFFGFLMAAPVAGLLSVQALNGRVSWMVVGVVSGCTWLLATSCFHALSPGRKMTPAERGALWVVYMPWFRGHREQPSERDHIERRAHPRDGTVALADARNPIQRLAIDHPLLAYLLGYGLVAGLWVAVMRSGSWEFVIVFIGAGVLLGCAMYWRSDLRRMSAEDRGRSHVIHLWPPRKEHK